MLLAAACSGPDFPPHAGGADGIMLVERGWHTDVALASGELGPPLGPYLRAAFPGARFLVFGFGDRAYFMAREATLPGTIRALFPGPAVILVTGLAAPPEEAFGSGHVLHLDPGPDGLSSLGRFLSDNFERDGEDIPRLVGNGPYPGSLFFAASEPYALFHNCNRWTAEALAAAGLSIDPRGVLFASQVAARALADAGHRPNPAQAASVPSSEAACPLRKDEKKTVRRDGN